MRLMLPTLLLITLLIFPHLSSAQDMPVKSANGFTCATQGGLVQCKGSFPGHASPVLNVLGSKVVGIIAQYPKHVWNYRSDTGCLCKGSLASVACTSSAGKKKTFKGAKKIETSSSWCLSSSR